MWHPGGPRLRSGEATPALHQGHPGVWAWERIPKGTECQWERPPDGCRTPPAVARRMAALGVDNALTQQPLGFSLSGEGGSLPAPAFLGLCSWVFQGFLRPHSLNPSSICLWPDPKLRPWQRLVWSKLESPTPISEVAPTFCPMDKAPVWAACSECTQIHVWPPEPPPCVPLSPPITILVSDLLLLFWGNAQILLLPLASKQCVLAFLSRELTSTKMQNLAKQKHLPGHLAPGETPLISLRATCHIFAQMPPAPGTPPHCWTRTGAKFGLCQQKYPWTLPHWGPSSEFLGFTEEISASFSTEQRFPHAFLRVPTFQKV